MSGFRIVTFNLLSDPGLWPRRAPLVRQELADLTPDVIALQGLRVTERGIEGLAPGLAAATGLPFEMVRCELSEPVEVLAGMSRFPIIGSDSLSTEEWGTLCQRLRVRVADGRLLDVYNLHLRYRDHGEGLHFNQFSRIIHWIGLHTGADGRVVCGDFGAPPYHFMLDPIRSKGFVSAHAEYHGREPEYTFRGRPGPNSYPRRDPKVVDYVFIDPSALTARDCRVVLDRPRSGEPPLYPSDHAGVMADLTWR